MEYNIIVLSEIKETSNTCNMDTIIAFAALVIAALSLLVSLWTLRQNNKINTTNLQAKYFEEIFKNYIVDKIPECVSKLHFVNGYLDSTYKELNNIMMDMINDSKYFAYAKHDFYEGIKQKTMSLEDKLIKQANIHTLDIDVQKQFIYNIHLDVMEIIKYINQNYHHF